MSEPQIKGAQLPLALVVPGATVNVLKVRGKGDLHHHLENLGFVEGASVRVVSENAGSLIVEVKGAQIALDKQAALKIITG
ncbi:MAG TPA: ferrous iron transport protein A [Candidatus Aveggerthella stercoripullorum]|uniref:Ferrous iron transport protein A n=1 Tax=Candidatus Aveggerthella stercoripullorum TaxID=2840688 RepID=A0A9D1D2P9_9ACTN|nr:ferrous iron transport protein A [Candidatus Aveggerthella stercoripullorum]